MPTSTVFVTPARVALHRCLFAGPPAAGFGRAHPSRLSASSTAPGRAFGSVSTAALDKKHCDRSSKRENEREVPYSLRLLMRSCAQPVAVVTLALTQPGRGMKDDGRSEKGSPSSTDGVGDDGNHKAPSRRYLHGATLSSFASVSLDPPLVTFSLRTPSRLADALQAQAESAARRPTAAKEAHFVINVLSAVQDDVAAAFARRLPLFLEPVSPSSAVEAVVKDVDARADALEEETEAHPFHRHRYHWTLESLPVLSDSLGALSCRVERWIDLSEREEGGSVLFVARVCRVEENLRPPDDSVSRGEGRLPLVYHRQRYKTVGEAGESAESTLMRGQLEGTEGGRREDERA